MQISFVSILIPLWNVDRGILANYHYYLLK
jgi:hypothetical protein